MIKKANKNENNHSASTGEVWRVIDGVIVKRGTYANTTYYAGDIVEIPVEDVQVDGPTIDDIRSALKSKILDDELDDTEIVAVVPVFPIWESEIEQPADAIVAHGGKLYRIKEAHKTKEDDSPDKSAKFEEVKSKKIKDKQQKQQVKK